MYQVSASPNRLKLEWVQTRSVYLRNFMINGVRIAAHWRRLGLNLGTPDKLIYTP